MSTPEPAEPPRLVVRPHPGDPTGVRAELIEHDQPAHIDFGDGSDTARVKGERRPVQHSYPGAGCYMITASGKGGDVIARQQVVIRGELHVQGVRAEPDMDGIRVRFDPLHDGSGVLPYYRLEWPDGEHEYAWGVPGTSTRRDAMPGRHAMRIVDTTSGRASTFELDVARGPEHDPDFTVGHDIADPTGMTIVLRVDAAQDSPLHIWWDDADGPQVVERPTVGMELPHRYNHPGHYMQTVSYAGSFGLDQSRSRSMSVPVPQPQQTSERTDDGPRPYPDAPVPAPPDAVGSAEPVPGDDPRDHAVRRGPVDIGVPAPGAALTAPEGDGHGPVPVAEYHSDHQPDPASGVENDPYDPPEPAPVVQQ